MKAVDVYQGSDGDVTKSYYTQLSARGPIGMVAMNLFRAQKCSSRAKVYRGGIRGQGSYRSMAYDRKAYSMSHLCGILIAEGEQLGIRWGWKIDPKVKLQAKDACVLYVDLPCGQVSFHSAARYAGPDYPNDWDGQHASERRILAFCDAIMEGTVEQLAEHAAAERVASTVVAYLDDIERQGKAFSGPTLAARQCKCAAKMYSNNGDGSRDYKLIAKASCRICRGCGWIASCPACNGAGMMPGSRVCGVCEGKGQVAV